MHAVHKTAEPTMLSECKYPRCSDNEQSKVATRNKWM